MAKKNFNLEIKNDYLGCFICLFLGILYLFIMVAILVGAIKFGIYVWNVF